MTALDISGRLPPARKCQYYLWDMVICMLERFWLGDGFHKRGDKGDMCVRGDDVRCPCWCGIGLKRLCQPLWDITRGVKTWAAAQRIFLLLNDIQFRVRDHWDKSGLMYRLLPTDMETMSFVKIVERQVRKALKAEGEHGKSQRELLDKRLDVITNYTTPCSKDAPMHFYQIWSDWNWVWMSGDTNTDTDTTVLYVMVFFSLWASMLVSWLAGFSAGSHKNHIIDFLWNVYGG